MDFPTGFDSHTTPLTRHVLDDSAAEALDVLAAAGFEIHAGLTPEYADNISQMALEPGIRRYCPRDCTERFKDRPSTEHWLAKGRAVFLLLKKSDTGLEPAGYGWVGRGTSEHVPAGEITFAVRLGEAAQGQRLATPFCRLIIAGAAKLYQAHNIWLEASASNGAAVHVYHKLGFVDVDQRDYQRTELDGSTVTDTRLYMILPDNKLATY